DEPVWWIAGHSTEELVGRLDELAGAGEPEGVVRVGSGSLRLAVVGPDDRRVRLARRMVSEGEPWRGRGDVWFSPVGLGSGGGRVVFLFPGVEPAFGAEDTDLPELAGRVGLEAPAIEDDSLAHRGASIYRLGIFLDLALRRLGVRPDIVAGHSIGEWAGSVASGVIPHANSEDLLAALDLDEVGDELPDLDFAALSGGAEAVAAVITGIKGVFISHDNSPGQSVICGPPSIVAAALARLREAGILGYQLTIQSGFHTPFMEESLGTFRAHLAALPLGPGPVPMWSATDVGPYPAGRAEIADLHLRHLVEPVRFRPLVERLYHEAGARIFVQVGIGSLPSFVDDTLRDVDHACVQVITGKRSAVGQMQRALTALWVEGLDVGLEGLRADVVQEEAATSAAAPSAVRTVSAPPAPPVVAAPPVAAASVVTVPYAVVGAADMLAHAAQAMQQVIDAIGHRLPARPAAHGADLGVASSGVATDGVAVAPAVSTPAVTAPAPAPGPKPWPTGKTVVHRHLSLENRPETLDHCLFLQPEGWHDPTDGFPIMAMTTQIQMLQDIVAEFAGGRDVVEVFDVRNFRWLDLSDPQDVTITLVPKGDDVMSVALGNFCRVNIRVGEFEPAPRYVERPLTNPRPSSHTPAQMFDQRVMFHGPRFQGITTLGPTADDGMGSVFEHLETPGSLLDNLGKIIAYYVIEHRSIGESPLPIGVERITFYGPDPEPGTEIRCDVRILEFHDNLVRANGELVLPDGTVWCRVDGWSSHVFHLDEVMEPIYHRTGRHFAAEPQPGGWNVLIERWPTGAGRDLTSHRFLDRAELARYATLNLLEQRHWLIEVAAVKDTVRRWLHETFDVPSFPVEIDLIPEGENRYRARGAVIPQGHDPCITVSSVPWLAVAVLGDGRYRDIEAREVPDGSTADAIAAEAAAAVQARNPDATVAHVAQVDDIEPSNIDAVVIPHFAVAWTE
ncbi:MAG TPA: acyltransferase domain-containing protein, partial [Acidimicrobiales bacterium]|nr:acyltransferase domain-containing protein [Acidimicrobiales bacterium]